MNKIKGFTPVSDKITAEMGLLSAVVYGKIWRYYDSKGICSASCQRLAEELKISERTIRRKAKDLEKNGYITIVNRKGTTSFLIPTNKLGYETIIKEVCAEEPRPQSPMSAVVESAVLNETADTESDKETIKKLNKETKDSSAKKPPKAKSQNDIRMETLETHFAAIRGCQPIDWKKDSPQRLQKLWRSPLKRILELRCGGDIEKAQIVIERAINKMLKEKLTVATPASIEKVCEDIAANMNRQGAERYYIPEGDELERQRLEFENAPPMKVD